MSSRIMRASSRTVPICEANSWLLIGMVISTPSWVRLPSFWERRKRKVAWAKNRTKSRVRAKVEHVFQVMKLKFGFVKVRYWGLKKNAHRLFVTCALVNLFLSRKKLLLAA